MWKACLVLKYSHYLFLWYIKPGDQHTLVSANLRRRPVFSGTTFPLSRSCSLKLHACSQGDAITVEEPGPKLFSTSTRLKTASLILVLEAVAFVEHICVPGGNAAEQTGGKYPVKSEWFRAEIPNGEC